MLVPASQDAECLNGLLTDASHVWPRQTWGRVDGHHQGSVFCSATSSGTTLCRYWTGVRVLKRTWPYDMWSLGVTWLELIMGTPHVFQVDPRTRVKLYHQLRMDAMSDVRLCTAHASLRLVQHAP